MLASSALSETARYSAASLSPSTTPAAWSPSPLSGEEEGIGKQQSEFLPRQGEGDRNAHGASACERRVLVEGAPRQRGRCGPAALDPGSSPGTESCLFCCLYMSWSRTRSGIQPSGKASAKRCPRPGRKPYPTPSLAAARRAGVARRRQKNIVLVRYAHLRALPFCRWERLFVPGRVRR